MKCYILSTAVYGDETWNTSESRSEIPGKFWNVVPEKDGKDQVDGSCEKWRRITHSQGENEYSTCNKTKEGRKKGRKEERFTG